MTPDDGGAQVVAPAAAEVSSRSGRTHTLAFVKDAQTEGVLRLGLDAAGSQELVVKRGDLRSAIGEMKTMATPRVLVVDISGDDRPMADLTALSEVVEPDVRVLVIGDRPDVNLYRQLIRTLQVAEYLYKPLNAEVVAQHFGPFVTGANPSPTSAQVGRIVTISSVCGGAGATTLAANLAWYVATEVKRHTVLLDANLHTGSAAMLLGAKTGGGLRLALESPTRADDLFMERIAEPAGDRLAVIAGEEKLTERPTIAEGAARNLLQRLGKRYNYLVIDVPIASLPWHTELLEMARQRVLVMEPTLQAVRDTLRAMALPMGAHQTRAPLVVLNKLGAPGTMTRRQVEDAMESKVDIVVPYLPRVINPAATMGTPAAERGGFRTAISEIANAVAATSATTGEPARRGFRFRRGAAP